MSVVCRILVIADLLPSGFSQVRCDRVSVLTDCEGQDGEILVVAL